MYRKIAVMYEDHMEGQRAFTQAIDVAKLLQLPLIVLAIAEPLPAYTAFAAAEPSALHTLETDRSEYYEQLSAQLSSDGRARGVQTESHVVEGDTVRIIADFVTRNEIDLLIVGLHHRMLRISSIWSTVYSLSQAVTCSILGVQ